MFKKLVCQWVK